MLAKAQQCYGQKHVDDLFQLQAYDCFDVVKITRRAEQATAWTYEKLILKESMHANAKVYLHSLAQSSHASDGICMQRTVCLYMAHTCPPPMDIHQEYL